MNRNTKMKPNNMDMNMKRHIQTLALTALLLLAGGMMNGAWARITYHILSLPITTYQRDGAYNIEGSTVSAFCSNVRVEALCCWGNDQYVGLPTEYKSPLISDDKYHYYLAESITKSATPQKLYGYTNSTYYFYTINGSAHGYEDNPSNYVTAGTEMTGNVDIYVTYEYDPDDANASLHMDLSATRDFTGDGLLSSSKGYNIKLKDRMLALNQYRQNRPGAVKEGFYTPEQLASDGFSLIPKGGIKSDADKYCLLKFKFGGDDPYNVTIYTAYDKPTTLRTKDKGNGNVLDNANNGDYDKYIGKGKNVYKEYRGASFFARLKSGIIDGNNMWLSSEADLQWTDLYEAGNKKDNATIKVVPGYFKGPSDHDYGKSIGNYYEMSPIFNSFAILNDQSGTAGSYVLAASKMNVGNSSSGVNNWQPRASDGAIQYLDYDDDGNNIKLTYKKANAIVPTPIYEVKDYIFRVVTPFGSNIDAVKEWSDIDKDYAITVSMVPDELKRKYVAFTGFYADAAHNTSVSTYADAQTECSTDASGRPIIYVDYDVVGAPFKAMAPGDSYTTATWYELTDEGNTTSKKVQWTGDKFQNNNSGGVTKDGEFAFMGDPYEMRIVNRGLSESNSRNEYVIVPNDKLASDDAQLNHSNDSTLVGSKWEIPYDAEDYPKFQLFGRSGTWSWKTSSTSTLKYFHDGSSFTRINIMEVGKLNYTFKIIDLAGNIAISATVAREPFSALSGFASIPDSIRSPLLIDETISFWGGYTNDGTGRKNLSTGTSNLSTSLTEYPGTSGNIFVTYTTANLASKGIHLEYSQVLNVKLNDKYIYWDSTSDKIMSNADPGEEALATDAYKWRLRGRDPYAMLIDNEGKSGSRGDTTENFYKTDGSGDYTDSSPETVKTGKFVSVGDGDDWANDAALGFNDRASASRFIAMMSNIAGIYEVMAASGNDTYYHIGCADGDGTEVKVYKTTTYPHGSDELRFELEVDQTVTYHLIDKSKNELFAGEITSKNPQLALPAEYVSPLVANYYYYSTRAEAELYRTDGTVGTRITNISNDSDSDNAVWVVYDTNDLVEYGIGSKMYKLKYDDGDTFHQEDGHDKMNATAQKAVYPYINGDCNFFVYGDEQLEEQMGGAASTRTRWAWYVESATSDPYHVKIVSRQQEPDAQKINQRMYFRTYVVNYDDANHVVTGTTTPGVTEVPGTEYMVLGLKNHYKLVTTDKIDDGTDNIRRTVDSFEQYWKTWETISNNGTGIDDDGNVEPDLVFSGDVTEEERAAVEAGLHTYTAWAKSRPIKKEKIAKRFANETHYYHTVNMGEGTFDFVEMEVVPVLVLLDQHGWEIMRKPLPTSTTDPDKEAKYAAIRPYNSPMVKEYKFWSKPTKARGHHYYKVANAITKSATSDEPYTSTDLTQLPPIDAKNVRDSYGDINDQYVTYVTKDEFLVTDMTFLVQQGENFAKTTDGTSITTESVGTGLADKIIGGTITNQMQWTLGSKNINEEMGIGTDPYPDDFTSGLISLNTFDPYNVQIQSVSNTGKFFTSNATDAVLDEGSTVSTTNAGTGVTLTDGGRKFYAPTYDNSRLEVTNSTFMVVQDANGNMQLMPRFDQNRRVTGLNGMANATTAAANDKTGDQTTFLVRPHIHRYIIVDNKGDEALRYQLAGDDDPSTPSQFISPLASNLKYYKTLSTGSGTDYDIASLADEITGSLAEAELTYTNNTANVYVRYEYNSTADEDRDNLLQGPWVTMTLGGAAKWVEYSGTLNNDGGIYTDTKPGSLEGENEWQWKFLESPFINSSTLYKEPDPYRVELFNRDANGGSEVSMATPIQVGIFSRFALLDHSDSDGGYALAAAGRKDYTYQFLNGGSMTAPSTTAASVETEASFGSAGTISDDAKITIAKDVPHTYTYYVITNDRKLAIQTGQSDTEAQGNGYSPVLPTSAQTPLLNTEDYSYYGTASEDAGVYTIDETTQIDKLYGLYVDQIYVRYPEYDKNNSPFKVPNERNTPGTGEDAVAEGSNSNYSPLDISGELGYNIIWLDDKMMYNNSGSVDHKDDQSLSGDDADEWKFVGGDPYALVIKSKYENGETKYYVDGTGTLANSDSQTFMLLKKEGYDYGMLAKTGDGGYRLTGYGNSLTAEDGDPNKYIIFALATHNLIYNLINPISGESTKVLTYRTVKGGSTSTLDISSTTKRADRGSSTYSVNAGKVSLGDKLESPSPMSRPYCSYTFYINKITEAEEDDKIGALSDYEGLKCTTLPDDVAFINRDVYVDVVYDYNTASVFESQKDYVANPEFRFNATNSASTTQWYTLDSRSATPALLNYKMTGGDAVGAANGRDLHYTNDYLWTAEGDPYGFVIHNRYAAKNASNWSYVVTTASDPAANASLIMSSTDTYAVYEMTSSSTDGYFRLHPINKGGFYVYNNAGTPKLSSTPTDWKFTLNEAQLTPYKTRAGYVGGLNDDGLTAYNAADGLTAKQSVVYDSDNIQGYEKGYYRLCNMPNAAGITTTRYLSGYRNKTELSPGSGTELSPVAIPLHFYGEKGVTNKTFEDLGTGNYTRIAGVWGEVPVTAPDYDPASIFYFSGASSPSTMSTQGLNVYQGKMDASSSTSITIEDLGGAVVSLHDGNATIGSRNYMHYNQASTIYDAKYGTGVELADYAKWCMEPAKNAALKITANSGGTGDSYYYTTFCAPFDVLMTDAEKDMAYVIVRWPTIAPPTEEYVCHPKKIGAYNTAENSCPVDYRGSNLFIPAGTPVIIRTKNTEVKLDLPTTTPSSAISSCVLSGRYLTQKLAAADPVRNVYVLGLPMTGTFTPEDDYDTSGEIKAVTPEKGLTGIGFYLNANPNREADPERSLWKRNNLYVQANKVYYRASESAPRVKAQSMNDKIKFIPVVFDEKGVEELDLQPDGTMRLTTSDGRIYDMQGRCVVTEQEVLDGSWINTVAPGIYILNGKKIAVK